MELDDNELALICTALATYREQAQDFARDRHVAEDWEMAGIWARTVDRVEALLEKMG